MDFEVLINDFYLNVAAGSLLSPAHNKKILSVVNDFEDSSWWYEKFENFVWDNIALTALSAQERNRLIGQSRSMLRQSAKNLRLTDKVGDISQGSELAEIVLYGIMHHHYGALSVVPKIFYKQNAQDNAKGADSVHIVLEGDDDFSLWFGEAKFYNSIEDARLSAVVKSVENSLRTDKLKKENSIITNTSDIDVLISNTALALKIKDALSPKISIDKIKSKINIPILLLHECSITAGCKEMDENYICNIKAYHLDRATAYFKQQVNKMSKIISKYSDINFHIIIFPVPSRENLIKKFSSEVAFNKA